MTGGAPGAACERSRAELDARVDALRALEASSVSFLVGGAYAFFAYTGIFRDTKDLDLFIRARDLEPAFRVLEGAGFRTELADPVWLGKAFRDPWYVDLIFSSGNGVAAVDEAWFEHARRSLVMDVEVLLVPPEEMIWSKSFVLERERYDGADVNHLLRACGAELDWGRLLARFDRYREILLSHLLLFRFAFPGSRDLVPEAVLRELVERSLAAPGVAEPPGTVCRGNLMSRTQYLRDLEAGLEDGRRWDEAARAREGGTDGGGGLDVPAGGDG
jgi:hypothetical protein